MRKLVYLLTLFIASSGFSQVYETGFSYHLGSVVGEVKETSFFKTSFKNIGFAIKKNMNPRISYRLSFNRLESNQTQVSEITAGIDFNFFDYNLIRSHTAKKSVPYVIFEVVALRYQNNSNSSKFTMALPIGIGYKKAISKRFITSVEAKARLAFTDQLDGITSNKSTLDAYYYLGISAYYTFGWPRGSKNQTRF